MADEPKPHVVDEHSISVKQGDFPTVWISFKTSDGETHGPFEMVPPYAHQFSDEVCVASARAARKVTNESTTVSAPADGS